MGYLRPEGGWTGYLAQKRQVEKRGPPPPSRNPEDPGSKRVEAHPVVMSSFMQATPSIDGASALGAQERAASAPKSLRRRRGHKRRGKRSKRHQERRFGAGAPCSPSPAVGYLRPEEGTAGYPRPEEGTAGYPCPEEGVRPPSTPRSPRRRRRGGKRARRTGGRATSTSGGAI